MIDIDETSMIFKKQIIDTLRNSPLEPDILKERMVELGCDAEFFEQCIGLLIEQRVVHVNNHPEIMLLSLNYCNHDTPWECWLYGCEICNPCPDPIWYDDEYFVPIK